MRPKGSGTRGKPCGQKAAIPEENHAAKRQRETVRPKGSDTRGTLRRKAAEINKWTIIIQGIFKTSVLEAPMQLLHALFGELKTRPDAYTELI